MSTNFTVLAGTNAAVKNLGSRRLFRPGSSDGVVTVIDVPGATGTEANGINGAGQIVGSFTDTGGKTHGFLAMPQPTPVGWLRLGIGRP